MDKKRGQVTIFVILGIVIVALIVLFLAFRKDILPPSSQSGINSEMRAAKKMIENCLEASADDHIRTIGIQGGYLTPGLDTFRLWNDTKISYLCFNLEGKITCRNRLLTLRSMEEQLSRAIEKDLVTCVDLDEIRGVEVIANEPFKVTTQILPYQVAIDLNYPVTINA
ncbi:MAG: hypothetical protein U9Q69_02375, partial [Nanoarchaeota archaeon]|nr:hypothetical protein [Nanoarchaeota archaeon]